METETLYCRGTFNNGKPCNAFRDLDDQQLCGRHRHATVKDYRDQATAALSTALTRSSVEFYDQKVEELQEAVEELRTRCKNNPAKFLAWAALVNAQVKCHESGVALLQQAGQGAETVVDVTRPRLLGAASASTEA